MLSTVSTKFFKGIPCLIPNKIIDDCATHYISYNNYDKHIYGSDTTAIVLKGYFAGAMIEEKNIGKTLTVTEKLKPKHYFDVFLILKGKHDALIGMNFLECIEYFSKNIHLKAKYSSDLNDYLNYRPFWVKSNSGVYGCAESM